MRRTARFYLIIILVLVFAATPFTMGWWFQQQYRKLTEFYNSTDQFQVEIQSYDRGWLNSKAVLLVKIPKETLRYFLAPLSSQDFPDEIDVTLQQDIQHGPVFYRKIQYAFGLATIRTKLLLSAAAQKALQLLGVHQLSLGENEALATFSGNYYKHSQGGQFQFSDPTSLASLQFDRFDVNGWIVPNALGFHGGMSFDHFSLMMQDQNELMMPHVAIWLDQDLQEDVLQYDFDVKIPKIHWNNAGITSFSASNVHVNGFVHTQNNDVSTHHQIDVDALQFYDEQFGPVHLDFDTHQLNARVIADLFSSYKKIMGEGELYTDQLEKKFSLLLPNLIVPGTSITVHSLTLTTSTGQLQLHGTLTWPVTRNGSPEYWTDFFNEGALSCSLRISQALVNELISIAAQLPFVQPYTLEERERLLTMQEEVNRVFQFNSGLLSRLMQEGTLSNRIGEDLYELGSDYDLADRYLLAIKSFYLARDISLQTTYILYLQFSYLQRLSGQFEQALTQHEQDVKRNLLLSIQDWVKQGYILVDKNDYVMTLSRDEGGVLTSNGRSVNTDAY